MNIEVFFKNVASFAGTGGILSLLAALILHGVMSLGLGAWLSRIALSGWLRDVERNWSRRRKDNEKAQDLPAWAKESDVDRFLAQVSPVDPRSLLTLTPGQLCGQISEVLQTKADPVLYPESLLRVFAPLTSGTVEAQRGLDGLQARLMFARNRQTYVLAFAISIVLSSVLVPEVRSLVTTTAGVNQGLAVLRAVGLVILLAATAALLVPIIQRVAARFFPRDV